MENQPTSRDAAEISAPPPPHTPATTPTAKDPAKKHHHATAWFVLFLLAIFAFGAGTLGGRELLKMHRALVTEQQALLDVSTSLHTLKQSVFSSPANPKVSALSAAHQLVSEARLVLQTQASTTKTSAAETQAVATAANLVVAAKQQIANQPDLLPQFPALQQSLNADLLKLKFAVGLGGECGSTATSSDNNGASAKPASSPEAAVPTQQLLAQLTLLSEQIANLNPSFNATLKFSAINSRPQPSQATPSDTTKNAAASDVSPPKRTLKTFLIKCLNHAICFVKATIHGLHNFIVIRHTQPNAANSAAAVTVLDPMLWESVKLNLQTQITLAKWAVLNNDQQIYATTMQDIITTLSVYLSKSPDAQTTLLPEAQKLAAQTILPDRQSICGINLDNTATQIALALAALTVGGNNP